jgi:hypothetical protein
MAAPSDRAPEQRVGRATLPWRRLSSFAGLPLISLLGSLTVIPVITSVAGAQGWAAVALGQAIGTGVATVLQYGWGFVGPTLVVGMDAPDRARLLWVSTLSRLVVAAVLFPLAAGAAAVLAPDGRGLLAALTAVALGTWGMSAYWFFVGTGRPGQAARFETVPRLVVQLAAALAALLTHDPIWYPVVFLTGQVATISWLTARLGSISFSRRTWAQALGALRAQRAAAATDAVVATVTSLPTSILAAVAPGALAVFAAGDRVQRLAQSGIQPLYNAFQGWVSEAPRGDLTGRMRLAVAVTGGAGVVAGTALAVGLPVVDRYLFAGQVQVAPAVSVLFGAALAVWSLTSSITFDVLAPAGRTREIFGSTAVGGLVAVVAIASLPPVLGAAGGAAAVLAAQLGTLAVQVAACRRGVAGAARAAVGRPAAPAAAPVAG